jgi:transcriptional regulator with XRE-family HTH domain
MPERNPDERPLPDEMVGMPQRVAIAIEAERQRRKAAGLPTGLRSFETVPHSQLSKLMKGGIVDVGVSTLIRIAKETGVRMAWLAVGEEPKEQQPVIGVTSLISAAGSDWARLAHAAVYADEPKSHPQTVPVNPAKASGHRSKKARRDQK